jgi:hypothetical protein
MNHAVVYDAPIGKDQHFRLWFWDITEFGRSPIGEILTYANFAIRDILLLVIELGLNIFTIVLFRNYFRNKAKLLGKKNKIIPNKENFGSTTTETPNITAQTSRTSKAMVSENLLNYLSIQEKNLTIMIIIMSFFSIIIHIFYLITGILLFYSSPVITSSTGAFVVFTCILKHLSNIIFLFFFNVNFRKKIKKMFTL